MAFNHNHDVIAIGSSLLQSFFSLSALVIS